MAILLYDKTTCPICGRIIRTGQNVECFPPFVPNELDPLIIFHDACVHAECFEGHELSRNARKRLDGFERHRRSGNTCFICKKEITDPDNYFTTTWFTDDENDPLFPFNYLKAHLSCLPRWDERSQLFKLVKDLKDSGAWRGYGVDALLSDLKQADEKRSNE
jgi:hypothetical protein